MAHSILSNSAVAAGGRVMNALLGITATALLTRYLGPGGYGIYSLLFSFGILIQLAADFGLYLTLTREIAKNPTQEHHIIAHVVSLRLFLIVGSLVVGGLITVAIPGLRPWLGALVVIGLGLVCQSLSQLLMGVFQKYSVVWRATVGDLVGRLAQIVTIMVLGVASKSVTAMAAAFSVGALATLVMHKTLLPLTLRYRPLFSWSAWKKLIRVSWPLGAMLILNAIYFRIDTLILSIFRTSVEVGHYGLAYRLVESGLFFPAMLGGLLLPRLTEAWQQYKLKHCAALLTESLRLVLVLSVGLVIVLQVVSVEVVVALAGASFSPAASLLRLLSVALAIMFFGNIFGFALVALERQKVLLWLYAVLAVGNTVLNILFIPRWGAVAAALTTIGTEGIAMVTAGIIVWRLIRYRIPADLILGVGASAVIAALSAAAAHERGVVVQLVLITLLYGGLNLLLGSVSKKHFPLLRASANVA